VDLPDGAARHPLAHRLGRRWDAAPEHLSRHQVKGIEGDLRLVQVKAGYDRHGVSSLAPAFANAREFLALSG
jgi:hypothetical protein